VWYFSHAFKGLQRPTVFIKKILFTIKQEKKKVELHTIPEEHFLQVYVNSVEAALSNMWLMAKAGQI
jgi:hypothetical protein